MTLKEIIEGITRKAAPVALAVGLAAGCAPTLKEAMHKDKNFVGSGCINAEVLFPDIAEGIACTAKYIPGGLEGEAYRDCWQQFRTGTAENYNHKGFTACIEGKGGYTKEFVGDEEEKLIGEVKDAMAAYRMLKQHQ